MAFYDKFPYTNFQELNLDRIVEDVGDIQRAEQATADSAAAAAASEAAAAQSETNAAGSAEAAAADAATVRNDRVQIARNTQDITTTNTRIDNLIVQSNPLQEAEVQDIRVAASGFTPATYTTAGDAVRGQVTELYTSGLTYKGALPGTWQISDLDNLTLIGFYNIPGSAAPNIANIPQAVTGILEVLYANGICIQRYSTYSPVTYERYRNSSAKWTAWKKIQARVNTAVSNNDQLLPIAMHRENRPYFRAHQGAKRNAPANSIPAYVKAGEMGFDSVQIAVIRQSADGTWYVLHDDNLALNTNGTGNLSESTDAYISTLHITNGYDTESYTDAELKIPTLAEVLAICKHYGMTPSIRCGTMPENINTAENLAIINSVLDIVERFDITRVMFSGNNNQVNTLKMNIIGDVGMEWFLTEITDARVTNAINTTKNYGYNNVYVLGDAAEWTEARVKALHEAGVLTAAYYDSPDFLDTRIPDWATYRALVEMGIDIIQTAEITYEDYKEYIDSTWSWNQ